jgi:phosphatidylserine/phosphatidylglycerophosphate/cardiolipin synthase-like enzyme
MERMLPPPLTPSVDEADGGHGPFPTMEIETFAGPAEVIAGVSPDSSYRLVKQAVEQARKSIDLYIYNVSAPHLVALLEERLAAGVAVRIMYDTSDTRGDERAMIESLDGAAVRVAPSSAPRRVFTVCHQKFAVLDRSTLLIGSANWASSAIPKVEAAGAFKKGNREWLLVIHSRPLARWFAGLFQADWDLPEMPGPDEAVVETFPEPAAVQIPAIARMPDEIFDLSRFERAGSIDVTPIVSPQNYLETVLDLIEGARESIDVQQQYIVDRGGGTRTLLEALGRRARDLEIRVIVSPAFRKEGAEDKWEQSRNSLAAHGLEDRLRAMNLRFYTHCHNKGLIVDRETVVVSSTNWSDNSIDRAREAGVVVKSTAVAGYFASVFDFDWGLAWDERDVPDNLAAMFGEAMFVPDAFEEIHPADLA